MCLVAGAVAGQRVEDRHLGGMGCRSGVDDLGGRARDQP